MCAWFSNFFENAFVKRVKRRFDMLTVRLNRSMYEVEMCLVIGMPRTGIFSTDANRPGEYLLAALFGFIPGCGLLLAYVLMTCPRSASP